MKHSSIVLVRSITCCLLVAASGGAQTPPRDVTTVLLDRVGAGRDLLAPKWVNGYFFTFDIPEGGRAPNVYLLDRNGRHVHTVPVVLPDSVETTLTDVSVSRQGELAIAGVVSDSVGRSTGFVAFVSVEGNIRLLVRTSPFTPRFISFVSDGSLWAAGYELDEIGMEIAEYNVLRHYGANGAFIKSTLSRSSFASKRNPVSQSFLVASGDTVGIYSVRANEWIEVSSPTGTILSRRAGLNAGTDYRVRGVALTSSGSVYVSHTSGNELPAVYKLARDSGAWQLVNGASGRIVGVDADMLVSQLKLQVIWAKVE